MNKYKIYTIFKVLILISVISYALFIIIVNSIALANYDIASTSTPRYYYIIGIILFSALLLISIYTGVKLIQNIKYRRFFTKKR